MGGAKFVFLILLAASICSAGTPLVLQVSDATAPPGGWAQIKVFSATPQLIATGGIALNLDPTVFGPVTDVAVFSADGDAYGFDGASDSYVDGLFNCGPGGTVGETSVIGPASGGIGKVRNLPILVVTVPVLSSAPLGQGVTVEASVGSEAVYNFPVPFLDPNGNEYDVSFLPGSVTIAGSLSVQSVSPGGGYLSAGTVIRINGIGFTSATGVRVDGVSLSATRFVSSQEIDVTLGAPAELTGKRFVLQNPNESTEFYSFLRVGTLASTAQYYIYPLFFFPLQTSSTAIQFGSPAGGRTGALVVQNPAPIPAALTIQTSYPFEGVPPSQATATVPAGGAWAYYLQPSLGLAGTITSSQPIRALQFFHDEGERVSPVFPDGYPLLTVAPTPLIFPPLIGSFTDAASGIQGSIAPGEIVTVHGTNLASAGPIGFVLDPSGNTGADHDGTQVLFDGKPAPLLYSSPNQINAIVPYEVAGQGFTVVSVIYNGMSSAEWGIPVLASAPSIFTLSGTGVGQAAVLNQDNSVNGPANPAARGAVLQLFATGAGVMSPAQATGSITSIPSVPVLPVHVTVGGADAPIQFVGAAPHAVAGLLQINVVAPLGAPVGSAVPISVMVGNSESADGATIALK